MPFLDITVVPVPTDSKAAYLDYSRRISPAFRERGALAVTEAWGEDVPEGQLTDFRRAVALAEGETVVVGWITWPDKAVRDRAWESVMQDRRVRDVEMPFDGKRMIFGAFEVAAEF